MVLGNGAALQDNGGCATHQEQVLVAASAVGHPVDRRLKPLVGAVDHLSAQRVAYTELPARAALMW